MQGSAQNTPSEAGALSAGPVSMLGNLFGQFVGGVIWGVGASVASSVLSGGNPEGLRDVTKMAVKTYLTAADRVMEAGDEVRRNFEAIVAEVETERTATPGLQS